MWQPHAAETKFHAVRHLMHGPWLLGNITCEDRTNVVIWNGPSQHAVQHRIGHLQISSLSKGERFNFGAIILQRRSPTPCAEVSISPILGICCMDFIQFDAAIRNWRSISMWFIACGSSVSYFPLLLQIICELCCSCRNATIASFEINIWSASFSVLL